MGVATVESLSCYDENDELLPDHEDFIGREFFGDDERGISPQEAAIQSIAKFLKIERDIIEVEEDFVPDHDD